MLIDPFTIIAQIANFAILAFALKYFLYDRVIKAMDHREQSIANRLSDAVDREADASGLIETYRQRTADLEHDERELLETARAEAADEHRRLLDEVRVEVDEERRRWSRGLETERCDFERELRRRTAHAVIDLSRTALSALARTDLETAVVELGIDRLGDAEDLRRSLLSDDGDDAVITVRTAFVVTPDQRSHIVERLRAMGVEPDSTVRFEVDTDLILGIEFRSDGTAIGWNASDYLDQLDASIAEIAATLEPTGHDR